MILSFLLLLSMAFAGELANDPTCPQVYKDFERFLEESQLDEKKLDELVLQEIKDSYFDLGPEEVQFVDNWNSQVLHALSNLSKNTENKMTVTKLKALYKKVDTHKVAGLCNVKKYDPGKNIGFCFGRAMSAHLEALRMNVPPSDIRKVWAVGTMKADGITWGHHVATMVRGKDGTWYVIDPEMEKLVDINQWLTEMKTMDVKQNLQIFISEPERFGPASPKAYDKDELAANFYNNYFNDLLAASREEAKQMIQQRKTFGKR